MNQLESDLSKIVLATRNEGKKKEFANAFEKMGSSIVSLPDDAPEVVEDADSFVGNAIKKAESAAAFCGMPALADDSGLCVSALDGAPGIYSARYAGSDANDALNNQKLLKELEGKQERAAHFVCVLALAIPGEETRFVEGRLYGVVAESLSGEDGFGYDPLFVPDGENESLALLGKEFKIEKSHRANAISKMVKLLGA